MKITDLKFMPEFFDRYINLVDTEKDLIPELIKSANDFDEIESLMFKHQNLQYQPNKWTPKEVLQHIIDNERIQCYRALVFSRNDNVVLPGYDEELYADHSNANQREKADLLSEFKSVRTATIDLFKSISDEQMHYEGICFKVKITPLALGFQIIGHAKHHIGVLKERYFNL